MVNYLAVIVVTLITYVLGALWYGPAFFGRQWMKLVSLKKKDMKGSQAPSFLLGFIGQLIMIVVFALLLSLVEAKGAVEGMLFGFLIWLGFIATVSMGQVLWEKKSWKLWILNNSYNLLNLLIAGLILGLWI